MDNNIPNFERKLIFGKRLKKARKAAGYRTQSQLAERLDITKDTVENWEQGKAYPTIDGFLRLCDLLGCSSDYLLGRINEKDHDIQFIHDFTGLSEDAIEQMQVYSKHNPWITKALENDLFYSAAGEWVNAILCAADLDSAFKDDNHTAIFTLSDRFHLSKFNYSDKIMQLFDELLSPFSAPLKAAEKYTLQHSRFMITAEK